MKKFLWRILVLVLCIGLTLIRSGLRILIYITDLLMVLFNIVICKNDFKTTMESIRSYTNMLIDDIEIYSEKCIDTIEEKA